MKYILVLILSLFLFVSGAEAWDVTVTGVNVTVQYTEPIVCSDGSLLTDLASCTIFYDITGSGTWVIGATVPASSPNGGGNMTAAIDIPINEGMEVDVKFVGTCKDNTGNESVQSNIIIKRIDRLAPGTIN